MKYKYERPTLEQLERLAETLRPCDIEELEAGGNSDILETLVRSCEVSREVYVLCKEAEPVALFGVAGEGRVGVPWLLGSTVLDSLPRIVLTESRTIVHNMKTQYDRLENFVYVKNRRSRKWLKWLGFSEEEPVPHGPSGELFCKFYWEKEDV